MSILATGWPTLLDMARLSDPSGAPAKISEVIAVYNDMVDDVPFVEGNLTTGHKSVLRAGIPAGTFRLINQGVVPVKSTGGQVTDDCAQIVNYAETDRTLVQLSGNPEQFRFNQEKGIIDGLWKTFAETLIYGDSSVDPEKFNGLASRYYTVAGSATSGNIIDAGGTGSDNTSIWLIGWSEETVFGIYPKGTHAGLIQEDKGQVTLFDAAGGRYEGYRSYYEFNCGLAVPDWRAIVRIANIDVSDLLTAGDASDSSARLFKFMSMALAKLPPNLNLRPVFYANNTVISMLMVQLINKSNVWLSTKDVTGAGDIQRSQFRFMGYPVKRNDAILSNEARIV